jgi:cyanobactin maturation PatA/PatG family protease
LNVLRECLASDATEELTGDHLLIYDQISRITGKARGALHLTRIREPDAKRNSVSFNYYKVAYTANADIKEELDAIAAIFQLPLDIYKPWLRDTADLRIIDVAAGRAWNGEMFVTIYHGDLSEPPPYIQCGEDAELKPASAGPVTSPPAYERNPLISPAPPRTAEDRVTASSLAAGNSIALVYAVGRIGIAYVSHARREQFARLIDGDPDDAAKVAKFLEANPEYSSSLIWTLTPVDSNPVYCLLPTGAYASDGFERLRKLLQDQLENDLKMASMPGEIIASVFLHNGQELAVISPALRGISAWSVPELLDEVFGPLSADEAERQRQEAERRQLRDALDRIYFELRNPGLLPRDRAINYAGTNIIQLRTVFHQVSKKRLHLAEIESRQSSVCRPGSDCWDISFIFFDPERRLERARLVYQITVDVSDVVPVSVGRLRHWYAY